MLRVCSSAVFPDDQLCFIIVDHSAIALNGHDQVDTFKKATIVITAQLPNVFGTILLVVHLAKVLMIQGLACTHVKHCKIRSGRAIIFQNQTWFVDMRNIPLLLDSVVDDFDSRL